MPVEARMAGVNAMNADLARQYEELDGLLSSTLDVDDHVDLESLKITTVEHPPFDPGALATPVPPMIQLCTHPNRRTRSRLRRRGF